ncbi:hypothetical protein CHGG_06290 [Chaetomium globosum CBS 148.51]|uniref:Uncharacterized protein n=1 Tax=Chaetomium globosum (strain ATCC 6205 / CBS 148.51 / DSM 1962 / NBRC 6347 / NRRL 1970) TaxID=306901 RepID=Q2H4X5_CHAGB|nr:uncharacterized protein CHGG_06290 [Chaetomium globosum CBS 148.51]EAQ89671.1 hypothetical protein CHGG_06290 [Chaetomium globosum CBS 148.51]
MASYLTTYPKTDSSSFLNSESGWLTRPPFTPETAYQKVKTGQEIWNGEHLQSIFTYNSTWREGNSLLQGRAEIVRFLAQKWKRQKERRITEDLIAFTDNRVCFLKLLSE